MGTFPVLRFTSSPWFKREAVRVPRSLQVFVALVGIAYPASMRAQDQPGSLPARFASDSAAWQRILVYVVSSLSTHLLRTASDSSQQPWRISFPPDAPNRETLEAQLRTVLRARPVRDEDSVAYEIEFGSLVIAGDTGRVRVRTDFAERCRGSNRPGGYGNVDRVYVVRHPPGIWSIARTEGVLHGDRIGCRALRR